MNLARAALSILFLIIVAGLVGAAVPSPPADAGGASPRQLRDEAAKAMEEGRFADAVEHYSRLRQMLPEAAQVPYNMAVAEYRQGNLNEAAELFNDAITLAEQAELRNRATYNLGNTAYNQSLRALQGQDDPQQAMAGLENATGRLQEALKSFKQALAADPENEDARANAEAAHRLLRQLEQLQQQMQQQNPQQGDQNQDQDQQQQDQQSQDQQQQQQGQQQDQQQSQNQQSEQEQQQDQQQQQGSPEQQQQDDQQQKQAAAEENEQQEQQQAQAEEQESEGEQRQGRQMTREEAERLLQRVRDKERQRREELARRQRGRHKPAEKDW